MLNERLFRIRQLAERKLGFTGSNHRHDEIRLRLLVVRIVCDECPRHLGCAQAVGQRLLEIPRLLIGETDALGRDREGAVIAVERRSLPHERGSDRAYETHSQATTSKPSNSGGPRYVPSGARAFACALRKASDWVQSSNAFCESHNVWET